MKNDVPLGEHRWLTLVGPGQPDGPELLLEPDEHPAAKAYTAALADDGIPAASFTVDDVTAVFEDLSNRGVSFTQKPTSMGPVVTVVLDDTCGNLIQLSSIA